VSIRTVRAFQGGHPWALAKTYFRWTAIRLELILIHFGTLASTREAHVTLACNLCCTGFQPDYCFRPHLRVLFFKAVPVCLSLSEVRYSALQWKLGPVKTNLVERGTPRKRATRKAVPDPHRTILRKRRIKRFRVVESRTHGAQYHKGARIEKTWGESLGFHARTSNL
jgi:hypothetical protein